MRSGSFLREPVTTSREFRRRTAPPTPPGRRPTPIWPLSSRTPSPIRYHPLRRCSLPSLPLRLAQRPLVFPETRPSRTLPSLYPTTFLDLPIFTDLAVTTSRMETTSVPDSTRLTPERIFTSESVSMPWDPFL